MSLKIRYKFNITTKLLVTLLGLSIVSIGIFAYFALNNITRLGNYALESNASLGKNAITDSANSLKDLGAEMIKQKALDTAEKLKIYLMDHPSMTLADIKADTKLHDIAVQAVGETGYTAIVDSNNFTILVHKYPEQEGKDLTTLKYNLPSFWAIVEQSSGGKAASGYYDWQEVDGSIRQKYTYVAPIEFTTADGSSGLTLWATTYISEFLKPVEDTQSKIADSTAINSDYINHQITSMRNTFVIIITAMIILVCFIAYTLAKRISKPIIALNEGAKIVGGGNLDYHLDVKTGDEIQDLANSFNKMTSDLKIHIQELQKTTAAKERIESELKVATDIQTSMLPRIFPPFPNRNEFDIFATMKPAKEVGGDFYDFFLINESKLCMIIGDICGKGVPAALFMAISKTLLKTEAMRGIPPDEVLSRVNNTLYPDNDTSMFLTVLCAIFNIETGEIQIANGGHNPPLIYTGEDGFEFVSMPPGFVVGAVPDTKFECRSLTLKPNDIIFMYTDGVTEATNPDNQLFSDKRLKLYLSQLKGKDIQTIIREMGAELERFGWGSPQSDDITMMALKFHVKKA